MDSVLQAGIVSAPLQVIIDRLATFTVRETTLILGADEGAQKLHRTLERVRALVSHIEQNTILSSTNTSWNVWLKDVEELLFRADNLLDEISMDLLKHKASGDHQLRNRLLSQFKLNVPSQINDIRQQLDDMCKEVDALFMIEFTHLKPSKILSSNYSCTTSFIDEGSWVGRVRERNQVLTMMSDQDLGGNNKVSVIPVVGMGGIGKTTLAQIVYNDVNVVDTFQMRMWCSVSVDFDAVRITNGILESATGKRSKFNYLEPAQARLTDLIHGKRFLLVLDNYWSEDCSHWDVLSAPFKVGGKGSKIIVTTRSIAVSRILGDAHQCCMEIMSDDDCWSLMKQRAYSSRSAENILEVEEIGKMIAKKCGGVPLAATTLGSMLQFKETTTEWRVILESEIWELPRDKSDVFQALSLSYHHLPPHLKPCFVYCAIFPKNHEFEMKELVLLWMAQGFIHPCGKMLLEDLGKDYFHDLLRRSFFQHLYINTHGQSIYKMHDLIHGMAQSISGNTCLREKDSQSSEGYAFMKNTRHFLLQCEHAQSVMLKGHDWYKNLRTFRVISESVSNIEVPYGLFPKLKFLRELNLSRMGLNELPDSIGCLKCLRYLNLSGNHFFKIPDSTTNLFGLLILNLEDCNRLLELPNDTKNMINLRHLLLDIRRLHHMPAEFGNLVNLVYLSTFIVGRSNRRGIGELKNMRFLRGSLCIKNLENVSHLNEAKEAMLHTKPFLETLEFEWNESTPEATAEAVLAGLQPHENLTGISLTNYKGFRLPSWFSNPLCNISSVYLLGCEHNNILEPLGKLQNLKSLVVERMRDWAFVYTNTFSGFPKLESLTLRHIPELSYWAELYGFPCLCKLDIIDCPMLSNLPLQLSTIGLQWLNISGCHELRSLPMHGFSNSLQVLTISNCDLLKGRCRVEEGEDWEKIKSIPKIVIDYVEINWNMRRL